MLSEKVIKGFSGWLMVFVLLAALALTVWALVLSIQSGGAAWIIACVLLLVVESVCFFGLTVVNPNEAKVV
jgi:hypothetical protein